MVDSKKMSQTLLFLVSLTILIISGAWVAKSLTKLSAAIGLRYFVVGFILLAVATTLPELGVGISSSLRHESILSLGNVLGSNIVDLSLIFGLVVLLRRRVFTDLPIIRQDSFMAVAAALTPLLLMLDGRLSRLDGLGLLAGFVFYLRQMIAKEAAFPARFTGELLSGCVGAFSQFLISTGLLLTAANYVVASGIVVGRMFGVPEFALGALALGLGTSLPELTFALQSVKLKKEQLALGDLMGSAVINSTLVLGLTALISPITGIMPNNIIFTSVVSIVVFILFLAMINHQKVTWPTAFLSIGVYLFYVVVELIVRR